MGLDGVFTLFNLEGTRWCAGGPTKAVFSFCGERKSDGANELSGEPGSERCGVCSDDGGLAQLVEHLLCKQGVTGSSPVTSTKWASSSAG